MRLRNVTSNGLNATPVGVRGSNASLSAAGRSSRGRTGGRDRCDGVAIFARPWFSASAAPLKGAGTLLRDEDEDLRVRIGPTPDEGRSGRRERSAIFHGSMGSDGSDSICDIHGSWSKA